MSENQGQEQVIPRLYVSLSAEERESAIYFLLESILKAKDQSQGLTRTLSFDEDVNIYLAHLLFAVSLPEYQDMAAPFLSNNAEEIFEWVREANDPMLRYFIFKVNADHLLIRSTIFNPDPELAKRFSVKKNGSGDARTEDQMAAVLYYNQASRCHAGVYDKKTGVGEVLGKIASQFDVYRQVLLNVKTDYFKFIECFREQAFQHFLVKLSAYERDYLKDIKMERFLELYQKWLITKAPELKGQILELTRELNRLDPGFRFDTGKLG
ncbi:MAG TPA: hypothetical protein P5561_00945 [Candidatus Omnitrophota bacterium]|nr:hypothetical protein [Candidatus Omnitrophota bacterium]HRY85079.1 hypothetical protein [Candidatus Omnitrophota bacterium]